MNYPLEKIGPVGTFKERLPYIDLFFNISIKTDQNDMVNYAPIIKVGFIGKGINFTDRMFVAEETEHMLIFVRNVTFDSEPGGYRRSVYIIPRKYIKYVHFDTGYVVSDMLDYSLVESEEVSKFIHFSYEDKIYERLSEIVNLDKNYKTKTKIIMKGTDQVMNFSLFDYIRDPASEARNKLGYFVPEDSIKYYHVMMFIGQKFGKLQNQYAIFSQLLEDRQNIYNNIYRLVTSISDTGGTAVKVTKKGIPKTDLISESLVSTITRDDTLQMKKIFVAWFLCEIMYPFFFI